MPPRRKPRQPREEFDYGELEYQDDDYIEHECKPAISLESWVREWTAFKFVILGAIGLGLILSALTLGAAVALIVRYTTTDNTGFDPSSPDFALYKNSRFHECYNLAPDATNCTAIRAGLDSHPNRPATVPEGFGYVESTHGWDNSSSHPAIYSWCQIVSCFADFKILPSTPRPSATILPDIACWWAIVMTSASALWHTGRQLWTAFRDPDGTRPCRKRRDISWLDYVFFIYDICGPIFWWWVSFGQFAADPAMSTTIAITSWVTAWKFGSVLRFHPYSCTLAGHKRTQHVLPWVLNVMAVLQWAAGVYVLSVYLGDLRFRTTSSLQGYDCLADRIPDAPGSTPCSATDLCGMSVLFRNGARFTYDDTFWVSGRYNLLVYFWLWTGLALMPFFVVLVQWFWNLIFGSPTRRDDSKFMWRVFNRGATLYLAFGSFIAVGVGTGYAVHVLKTWNSARNREGPFTFHSECNALHVPLSPWSDYLDMSEYNRAYRIAKMVFNA